MSSVAVECGVMDRAAFVPDACAMVTKRKRTFIKEWRQFRRLTQQQLGDAIDKDASQISNIESGRSNYTQETLEAIADALDCEPADLLVRHPQDPDGIWAVWDQAKAQERRTIVELARTILKTANDR